jgi:hypothetical protein
MFHPIRCMKTRRLGGSHDQLRRTGNYQLHVLFTIVKCHAIQQPKSHAICVMTDGSDATVVKVSRVPTAAMPSAIVSQLFLAVDGRTEQMKPSYWY